MSSFSVENPQDGKTFENYTRFEWGVEVGVVTTFMLRLLVPHEFDMKRGLQQREANCKGSAKEEEVSRVLSGFSLTLRLRKKFELFFYQSSFDTSFSF